jgi:hypothetical protein
MASAVGVIPIALHFLPGHRDVFSILAPSSKPLSVFEDYFRWIAIRFVTTAFRRLIGHEPRRIELLVDGQVGGGVSGVVLLGTRMNCEYAGLDDEKDYRDQTDTNFDLHGSLLGENKPCVIVTLCFLMKI